MLRKYLNVFLCIWVAVVGVCLLCVMVAERTGKNRVVCDQNNRVNLQLAIKNKTKHSIFTLMLLKHSKTTLLPDWNLFWIRAAVSKIVWCYAIFVFTHYILQQYFIISCHLNKGNLNRMCVCVCQGPHTSQRLPVSHRPVNSLLHSEAVGESDWKKEEW